MDNPVFFVASAAQRDNLANDPRTEPQAFKSARWIPGEQDDIERCHTQRARDLDGSGEYTDKDRVPSNAPAGPAKAGAA